MFNRTTQKKTKSKWGPNGLEGVEGTLLWAPQLRQRLH